MADETFKAELRVAISEYGPQAAAWMAEGREAAEMAALARLGGTPLGEKLSACKPRLLTGAEAAELFGLSANAWLERSRRGRLPDPVKIGATLRWRTSDLAEWAAGGCPIGGVPRAAPQPDILERANGGTDALIDISPAAAAAMAGLSVTGLANFARTGLAPAPNARGRFGTQTMLAWIRDGCPRVK
ncbi:MAG TPA: helix-turn-helix domain-containing protein [Phycisphaerae bacterium]|nr:helix-turn-helix domain-containing protein [Phycisphaerae bacterium]